MAEKIKVVLLAIWYPLAMASYFRRALERRADVDLVTTGPFTGTWIPWMGGMNLNQKYVHSPTYPLPFRPDVGRVPYEMVKVQLPDGYVPDLVLTVDAGISWMVKPYNGIVAHVATDPHVLDYSHARLISDKFFNMQKYYMKDKDIYLPYAFDPTVHYQDNTVSKDTDAVLVGMPYAARVQWVDALRNRGLTVIFENGPVFDEYRQLNNRASIGLNWASSADLNARVFELMGMGLCPVINRVPDLKEFFVEDVHYLGFSDLNEAIEKVIAAKNNPEGMKVVAKNAYECVWKNDYTYDARINQIFMECGL